MVRVAAVFVMIQSAAAASCTTEELNILSVVDPSDKGKTSDNCWASAFDVVTGSVDREKFDECFMAAYHVSHQCAECYADLEEYENEHCKANCLLGWCKQSCLDCTAPAQKTLAQCVGASYKPPSPCLEANVVQCSATDQSILMGLDPEGLGETSDNCAMRSLKVVTGDFDPDKFDACFVALLNVSHNCADCYATSEEYNYKNCKAHCLLGWCKQSCLDCTAPSRSALSGCTGTPPTPPPPCVSQLALV